MAEAPTSPPDPAEIMRSRQFVGLLVLAAIVGVVASFAAWVFLEAINEAQDGVWSDLPNALGFDHTPLWWGLPVLFLAGLVVAFAIVRLPGNGGHIPAEGLNASPTQPIDLPGVILAAVAGIALGAVVGPEAPLLALGGGLGFFVIRRIRADAPMELQTLLAACGTFAAVSFLFGSPLIAAVILIEATGPGGRRLPLVLIPGLLAAGIGTLVEVGMGSWTGVNTSVISLQLLELPDFARPDLADFLWTIPFAAAIALGTVVIFRIGRFTERLATPRPFVALPVVGLAVATLAIIFTETTDHGVDQVLFSGQEALEPLTAHASSWSLSALALLLACKGIAYGLALGSFRGGPTFPAMFLGAAAGVMASHLAGFDFTPAVAVGLGAGTVAVLRLPLSAVVLATVLTASSGLGSGALIIVGVVVAYLVANLIDPRDELAPEPKPAQAQ